jgi:hypothetical protein
MSMDPFRPPDELDFDNPYAAPKTSFEREEFVVPKGSLLIPCSIDAIVSVAWSIFQKNTWACLQVVWAMLLIDFGLRFMLSLVVGGLAAAMPGEEFTVQAINFGLLLVSLVIQLWLGIGMNMALLRIARGQPISFDMLFSGGRYLLRSILAWIVVFLLVFGTLFLPMVLMAAVAVGFRGQSAIVLAAMIGGGIGLIVLMFYMMARLWLIYFVVIDQNAGVLESVQRTWGITRGHAGTIIMVYLSQLVFTIAGALALCVGLVVAIPFNQMLLVVTYLSLTGPAKPAQGAEHPPVRTWFTDWEEEL